MMKPLVDASTLAAGIARRLCTPSRAHLLVRSRPAAESTEAPDAVPITATPPASAPVAA